MELFTHSLLFAKPDFEPGWKGEVRGKADLMRIVRFEPAAEGVPASTSQNHIIGSTHLPASILFWSKVRAARKKVHM